MNTSKTTVVNLRREEYDVYIGRAGHGHDGYFGNPVKVGVPCPVCGNVHTTPKATLHCFGKYFDHRLSWDHVFAERIQQLRGQRLGCFCKPAPCHGDIIAMYLNTDGKL